MLVGNAGPSASSGTAPHPYRWTMLFAVWLAYSCFGLTTASLGALVKPITDELGLSHTAMGSVMGTWQLVYIALAVPCGALLDRFGARRALFVSGVIIALSNVLRGVAVDYAGLVLAVALFGVGGPLMSIGAPKLIARWFEGNERGLAMGIYITGPALGGIAALSLTNSVVVPLAGDWRGALFVYAGWALASSVLWLAITAHPAARRMERLDAAEPKRPQRQVLLDLARNPAVQCVLAMSVGIFFLNHGINNWMPEILRSGGMTPAEAGYWASLPPLVGILGALFIPRLAADPRRRHAVLGGLFVSAGIGTLLIQFGEGPLLALGLILQGVARTSMMTTMVLTLAETRGVDKQSVGMAGGMFFSAAEIGGVLGPLTTGFLSDISGGFDLPLSVLTGICGGLLLLLMRLRQLDRRAAGL